MVGLFDSSTAHVIRPKNFVEKQGLSVGLVIIYQDNFSCMALTKRVRPGSKRSCHINIHHLWVPERVANGEVAIEHLITNRMYANVLTKPEQGAHFES